MADILSVLERSLVSNRSAQMRDRRREELRRISNPVKRLGGLTLHHIATKHPSITSALLRRDPEREGLQYAGEGYQSIVYQRGEEVIKVHRQSVRMSEENRQLLAGRLEGEHFILRNYLGNIALAQNVLVADHPVIRRRRAVQIVQRFHNFSQLAIFSHSPQAEVAPPDLEADMKTYPGVEAALHDLVAMAGEMFEATGLLPDTVGRTNLVMTGNQRENLTLIDAQPIGPDFPLTQQRIVGQLATLDKALAEVGA